jgi:tetratricopeptide (TPR) repeat protein
MTVDVRERGQLNAEAASLYRQLGDTTRAEELAREIAAEDVPPAERLALAEIVPDAALALTLARAAVAALPAGEERQRALRLVALRAQGLDDPTELAALEALFADGQLEVRPRLTELLLAANRDEEAAPHLLELLRAEAGAGQETSTLLARLRHVARGPVGARALAEALVLMGGRAERPQQAVALLREAARLRADRDDFAGAADALQTALTYAPGDALLVADLMTMLGDLGLRQRLREVLQLHLATLSGEARLPILRKLLPLVEELRDATAAAELLAETRRLEPQAAARVNVRALARMMAPPGRNDGELRARIADAQSRLQQLPAEAVPQQRAVRLKLAELFRDAGRLADAFEQAATVLAEEPGNVVALRLLVEIAESDGRWLDAAQALDRLSYLLPTEAERAAALARAGDLHLLRLNDKEAASDCFLKAIDLLPTHAPTLRRLIDYFWSTGDEASAAEMAAALDDEGGFAAAETTPGTRGRAALATAYAGDARRAVRMGTILDEPATTGLAAAALELAARGDEARVAQALRQMYGAGSRLAALRRKLEESREAAATALAARLG